MTEYALCCLRLVPLSGKSITEPRLPNEILAPGIESVLRPDKEHVIQG